MVTSSLLPEPNDTSLSAVVVNEPIASMAQKSVRLPGRRNIRPTEVQQQLQVMFRRQRVAVLQRHGEGLSPADDQTLPIDLPGAVRRVVFVTLNIDVVDKSWRKKTQRRSEGK